MIELHPEILKKNGSEFVVLPSEEFAAIRELLDDYEDLLDLRAGKAAENSEPSTSIKDVRKDFGL